MVRHQTVRIRVFWEPGFLLLRGAGFLFAGTLSAYLRLVFKPRFSVAGEGEFCLTILTLFAHFNFGVASAESCRIFFVEDRNAVLTLRVHSFRLRNSLYPAPFSNSALLKNPPANKKEQRAGMRQPAAKSAESLSALPCL